MEPAKSGRYKARAIDGMQEYGESSNGTLQLMIVLDVPELGRQLRTYLYFSEASAPFSIDRLRALGWTGDDLRNLDGIDANEVDIDVKSGLYEGKTQTKVDIVTRGSSGSRLLDAEEFARRVAALGPKKT